MSDIEPFNYQKKEKEEKLSFHSGDVFNNMTKTPKAPALPFRQKLQKSSGQPEYSPKGSDLTMKSNNS